MNGQCCSANPARLCPRIHHLPLSNYLESHIHSQATESAWRFFFGQALFTRFGQRPQSRDERSFHTVPLIMRYPIDSQDRVIRVRKTRIPIRKGVKVSEHYENIWDDKTKGFRPCTQRDQTQVEFFDYAETDSVQPCVIPQRTSAHVYTGLETFCNWKGQLPREVKKAGRVRTPDRPQEFVAVVNGKIRGPFFFLGWRGIEIQPGDATAPNTAYTVISDLSQPPEPSMIPLPEPQFSEYCAWLIEAFSKCAYRAEDWNEPKWRTTRSWPNPPGIIANDECRFQAYQFSLLTAHQIASPFNVKRAIHNAVPLDEALEVPDDTPEDESKAAAAYLQRLGHFSDDESVIATMKAAGQTEDEIAEYLNVSVRTVRRIWQGLKQKATCV
jgi:DNA-binding CsgD family transcriptional regulator